MNLDEQRKKVYDESVSLIADLGFRQGITMEEMDFLLTLLDMVFVHNNNPEFLNTLRQWVKINSDSEIDEIIKATIIAIDFNDPAAVQECIQAIAELLE